MTAELRATGIRMQFGGVVALDDVSLSIRPGSVHGLIGRNGSGKSTMFNCITGFLKPTAGKVTVDGTEVTGWAPHTLVRAGVVRTFQTPRVDLRATVKDAVLCGYFPTVRSGFVAAMLGGFASRAEERKLQFQADVLLGQLGLHDIAQAEIGTISMGQVRLVEVARGLASGAKYLLFDEPAAGLARREQGLLVEQIRTVARRGIGVLLVEHNFALIRDLCDEITVLDTGRLLCHGTPAAVASDRRVVESYLGATQKAGVTA